VVNSGRSPATAAARISYPSARAVRPLGVLMTMSTCSPLISSTIDSSVESPVTPDFSLNFRTMRASMPLRLSTSAVPSVAMMS
jgi:hypothetical protein